MFRSERQNGLLWAFDCNANFSKNKVRCSWFKFPTEPTLFKKANFKPTKHSRLCSLRETLFHCDPDQRRLQLWVFLVLKSNSKRDDVPTLFTVVKAMLMPAIRRTQAATRASSTTVHLGSKRAVSVDTGDVGSR